MQPSLEHFSERLVSGMSEAVVLADATGLIQFWNLGAVRMFGFTDTEALGLLLDIIIPESLRSRQWQWLSGHHADRSIALWRGPSSLSACDTQKWRPDLGRFDYHAVHRPRRANNRDCRDHAGEDDAI